jgi:hypothetical protein
MIARTQPFAHFLLPVSDNQIQVFDRHELKRILNDVFQNAAVAERLQNQGAAIRCDRVLAGGKDDRS